MTSHHIQQIERFQASLKDCSTSERLWEILHAVTFPSAIDAEIVRAVTTSIQPIINNMKVNRAVASSFSIQNFGLSLLPTALFSLIMQCTSAKDLFRFCAINKYFQKTILKPQNHCFSLVQLIINFGNHNTQLPAIHFNNKAIKMRICTECELQCVSVRTPERNSITSILRISTQAKNTEVRISHVFKSDLIRQSVQSAKAVITNDGSCLKHYRPFNHAESLAVDSYAMRKLNKTTFPKVKALNFSGFFGWDNEDLAYNFPNADDNWRDQIERLTFFIDVRLGANGVEIRSKSLDPILCGLGWFRNVTHCAVTVYRMSKSDDEKVVLTSYENENIQAFIERERKKKKGLEIIECIGNKTFHMLHKHEVEDVEVALKECFKRFRLF